MPTLAPRERPEGWEVEAVVPVASAASVPPVLVGGAVGDVVTVAPLMVVDDPKGADTALVLTPRTENI